jgi:RHS repeat-associated protein
MLVEEVTGGKEYYYHPDRLGSVRALTDSDGGVTDTYNFDAYGNRLASSTGTTYNPFGYTGQYTDAESGLLYLRARYYDPSTQQFLTVDPIVAQTEQAYAYAGGNPTNFTDPTGMFPCLLCINPVQALCNVFGGCLRAGVTAAVIVQKTYRVAEAITMGAAADAVGKACSMAGNLIADFAKAFFGMYGVFNPYGPFVPKTSDLKLSKTVENHINDIRKNGRLSRPYMANWRQLVQEIMEYGPPGPDPRGAPGRLFWRVPGFVSRNVGVTDATVGKTVSSRYWELLIDPKTNTVEHFLWKSGP